MAATPHNEFDIEQNTNEWLEMRLGPVGSRINSSEIGKATGLSRWDPPASFYLMRCGLTEKPEANAAMNKGHLMEDACARKYEEITGRTMRDGGYCTGSHALYPRLFAEQDDRHRFGASVDRRCLPSDDYKCDLECKCPATPASYLRYYADDTIQWTHLAQMHMQMAVRGHDTIHYMVTLFDDDTKELMACVLREVQWSETLWQWMAARARRMSVALTAVLVGGADAEEVAPLEIVQIDLNDTDALPFEVPYYAELYREGGSGEQFVLERRQQPMKNPGQRKRRTK